MKDWHFEPGGGKCSPGWGVGMFMPQDDFESNVERMSHAWARLRLLADAGVLLSGSLEWEQAVSRVAELAVERFCDGCAVDFLDEHGALRRLTSKQAGTAWALPRDGGSRT